MKVVVTGANGKVGSAAVTALQQAGHEVTAVDLAPGVQERRLPTEPEYYQADLADPGDAYAVVVDAHAVVHAAAIPSPEHNSPHEVFATNLLATFNTLEAAVRAGVDRFVNISSESVPGHIFAQRPFAPAYAPIDEDHPVLPQDPYALSKHFGEQLMDAAVRRSDIRCLSLRPSWVQWEGNYARSLGPHVGNIEEPSGNLWSYLDIYDLADAIVLAVESELPGHEVLFIASPDNAAGLPLADLVRHHHGDTVELRPTSRPDASGIDCGKAARLLGWTPTRSWRDYLDDHGRSHAD